MMSPIWYTVDGFLMSCTEREQKATELLKALSKTQNLQVF